MADIVKIADEELHIRTLPLNGKIHKGNVPMAYSSICAMFKMPFYMGKLKYHGEVIRGNHPPMVSEEEFERVQSIIDPLHTTRPKDKTYNFQLRNLFKCGECGLNRSIRQSNLLVK